MKTFITVFVALLSLHCISIHAFADEVFVDFEDAALAEANFVGLNPGFFFIYPYGGRGNSGSISTTWLTRQNYIGKSFDFSKVNTSITVSTFFHLLVNDPPSYPIGQAYGEVYLVPSSSELEGNINKAFVNFSTYYASGEDLSDNIFGGSLAAPGGSFPGFSQDYPPGTFKPGYWYELKVTFTNLEAMIRYEITINEYDDEGLNFVQNVVQTTETTVDSFGLTNDTEVFAGFSFDFLGVEFVDDFSISTTPTKNQLCAYLGNDDYSSNFDRDLYQFEGSKGEKITITLEIDEDGENNGGKRAILILKNKRKKVRFFKIDRTNLPNQITTTLPVDGKYTIVVAEFPGFSGRKQFQGDYCLTVEGTTGILKTFSE